MSAHAMRCPKCGADAERASSSGACAACGLRRDLWASFDDTPAPLPGLDEAFLALAERWDDPAAHDAFLALARAQDSLDAAALRYRRWLREHPGDAAAKRALAQAAQWVVATAQTLHENAPEQAQRLLRPLRTLGTVFAFLMAAAVGFVLYRTFGHR